MSDFFKETDCDMSDFVGVKTGYGDQIRSSQRQGISLDKANRLLKERGTVMYVKKYSDNGLWGGMEQPQEDDTHRALLINIEPIVKDSLEKLTIDMLTTIENGRGMLEIELERFKDRARKLLFQAADTER